MFCTKCGTEVGTRATCPACGAAAPVPKAASQPPTPADPPAAAPSAPWSPASGDDAPTTAMSATPPPPPGPDPTTTMPVTPPPPVDPPTGGGAGGGDGANSEGDGPKGRKVLIGVVVVLALIALGVGGAIALTGGKKDNASKDTVTATDDGGTDTTTTTASTTTTEGTTTTTLPESVPDLVGKTLDEAQALVDGTGITLKVVNVASETKPTGTIVDQTPKGGEPYADTIVVKVARPPVKTFLADLDPVEGDNPQAGSETINANTYTHSVSYLACDASFDSLYTNSTGYDLGRKYLSFSTDVGLADSSGSGGSAKFEVLGDGNLLGTATVGLGETKHIDADVTGVLRLTIVVTGLTCGTGSNSTDVRAALADPQLTSPPDATDAPADVTTTTGL